MMLMTMIMIMTMMKIEDYHDDPGYSLEPRVSGGERFGREEGKDATVLDFGCRKEPIWKV